MLHIAIYNISKYIKIFSFNIKNHVGLTKDECLRQRECKVFMPFLQSCGWLGVYSALLILFSLNHFHNLSQFDSISDPLKSDLSVRMTSEQVSRLVKFSGQIQNAQLSYNSAAIISKLEMTGNVLLTDRKHQIMSSVLSHAYEISWSLFYVHFHPDEMVQLLRPHYVTMLDYLLVFLRKKDVKFQHLSIVTVFNLKKGLYPLHTFLFSRILQPFKWSHRYL